MIIRWWKFRHRFHYRLRSETCVPAQSMSIFFSLWCITVNFLFLIITRKISYSMSPLIPLLSYIVTLLNIHTKISSLCSHPFLNCFLLQHVNISTPFYIISHARCCYVQATSDVIFSFISCWKWKDLISLNRSTDRQTDGWTNLLSVVLTLLHAFFLYLLSYSFFSLAVSFSTLQKPFF